MKYNENRCTRVRFDNNKKYFNKDFIDRIIERNIRFKFIIVNNLQINNSVECLNQTIMRKINIFLKNNNIVIK